jgi:hypothetical protein
MSGPLIVFEQARSDIVTAVVIPIDGITRRTVPGVDVELWDPDHQVARPFRLVRNLSGHAVLLNQPADQDLTFRVLPGRAGYRGPVLVTFNPARDGVRRVVPLERRPDAGFGDVAILVRGWVVRSGGQANSDVPVAGVMVSARPTDGPPGQQFPATTGDHGDFALAVGRPPSAGADAGPFPTTLHFAKDGLPERDLEVELEAGRVHVFSKPIDLDGTVQPPFTDEMQM